MYSEWYRSFCGPQLHSYVFSLEEAGILSSGLCNLNDSVNVTPPVLRESKNPLCSVTCLWDLPASFVFHCIAMFVFQVCLCSCFQVLSVNISKQSIIQTHLWWALTQVFSGAPGTEILNKKQSGMKKIHFSLTSIFFFKGIRFVPVCRKDTKHVKTTCNDVGTPITASTSSSSFSNADSSNVPDLTVSLSSRFSSLHCISFVNFHSCLFCFAHHQHLEVSQMI